MYKQCNHQRRILFTIRYPDSGKESLIITKGVITMFCLHCGTELTDEAILCHACGSIIKGKIANTDAATKEIKEEVLQTQEADAK